MFQVNKRYGKISCLVAVGANLTSNSGLSPRQSCEVAVRQIAYLPFCADVTRSRWYASAPVPASDQPRYVNGVVRLTLDENVSARALLSELQMIEHAAGRVRGAPNAARTLDLDIIDFNGLVLQDERLVLPHPRAHERAFVLLPLRDVAPGWCHPALHISIQGLIDALSPQDTKPL